MKLRQGLEGAAILARNLMFGGSPSALTLARRPREMALYVTECLFLWKIFSSRRGLPQRNVFEVIKGKGVETVKLGNLHGPTWMFRQPSFTADIVSLCLICRMIKPRIVFEIGTMEGYTALHFALNTPQDAKIYTLDLPRDSTESPALATTLVDDEHISMGAAVRTYFFDKTEVAPKITCLYGDSARFDFSPFHGQVDFFFIDGAHSYEYVRSDTLNALECCRPGSVIAWHDFGRVGVNGVSRWLRELSRKYEIYSIPGGSLAFMIVK